MYGIRRYANLKNFVRLEQYGRLANIGQCSSSNDLKRTFYTYSPEPSQPINRDPTFCSIEDAVKCVKSGKYRDIIQQSNSKKISHEITMIRRKRLFVRNVNDECQNDIHQKKIEQNCFYF